MAPLQCTHENSQSSYRYVFRFEFQTKLKAGEKSHCSFELYFSALGTELCKQATAGKESIASKRNGVPPACCKREHEIFLYLVRKGKKYIDYLKYILYTSPDLKEEVSPNSI